MRYNSHRAARVGSRLYLLLGLLLGIDWAAARTYRGVVVDEATGKPVEGVRILCRGMVPDHGFGNWLRYTLAGGDFADTDSMILDAAVTGPDGAFRLVVDEGRPYRTISLNKNGAYGVFNHSVVLSDNMVIRIQDQPLRDWEGATASSGEAAPDAEAARVLFATHTRGNGTLYCLDGDSGTCLWQDCFYWDASAPAITVGGRAFVGTEAGFVLAYDLDSGKRLWHCQTHQEVTQIANDATSLFVTGGAGCEELLAISQATGRISRRIDTDTALKGVSLSANRVVAWSDRAVHLFALPLRKSRSLTTRAVLVVPQRDDAVYMVERDPERTDGTCLLSARSWDDLAVQWQCTLPQEQSWRRCFVLPGKQILCVVGQSNIGGEVRAKVCAYNTDSGRLLWTYETPMQTTVDCILVPESRDILLLHTGGMQNKALCLSAKSGNKTWSQEIGAVLRGHTPVLLTRHPLLLGRGFIHRVRVADGERVWSYPEGLRGDIIGLPASTRSSVYAVGGAAGDGISLVRLSAADGLPLWRFAVPGEILAPITCVPGNPVSGSPSAKP